MTAIVVLYARPAADFGSTVPATLTNAPSSCCRERKNASVFSSSGSGQPNVL